MATKLNMVVCNYLICSLTFNFSFYLTIIIPCATPLSFNFSQIGPQYQNTDIVIEGNGSSISSLGIQITPNGQFYIGRATYIKPLHLWDSGSGELANFNTHFSFVIDSSGSSDYADGLTFFMARNNSVITCGGALGLPINVPATCNFSTYNAPNPFVAVEFDSYSDYNWDPTNSTHAGININNLTSIRYENWWSNIPQGGENEVWISYDSTSKNLSVVFTGYQNNTRVEQDGLYYTIDLRTVLPEWVIFGFTASTGFWYEKNTVLSWDFNSSEIQVNDNNGPAPTPKPGPVYTPNVNNKRGLVVGLSVGLCVLLGGLGWASFGLWKKRRREKKDEGFDFDVDMDNDFEMDSGPRKFPYAELARATNNFAEDEKLGEGGFGGVYKGFLRELSSYVAVKRVSRGSKQGIKEYASEVKIISRLRHRNLVQLLGWCHEKKELLLVYEYMENGSLDYHLFKEMNLLTWGLRYKIAQGLASALLYLHEEWDQCVVHRDIKSSNIMLDSSFNAKLGDFGLARLVDHEKGSHTTVLAGTMGYMAPECVITGQSTKESDVFSFGVVVLEIVCGRKPIEFNAQESQISMLEWVWDLYGKGKLLEATDPKISRDFDQQEVENLMILGLWCAHPDCNFRPSIRQAIHVLNFESPLPILPRKMPMATYFTSSGNTTTTLSSAFGPPASENGQTSSSYSHNTDPSKFTPSSGASSPSSSLLYTR